MNVLRAGAVALLMGLAGPAFAAPQLGWGGRPAGDDFMQQVQMQCDYNRCIDPRSGAYTQSSCNRGRCVPLGGIVGYDRSGGQPGYGGPRGGGYERRGSWQDDGYARPRREWRGPPSGYYEEPPRRRWRQPAWDE